MALSLEDQDWRAGAACAAAGEAELWFAVGAVEHKKAKLICRHCNVRRECLSFAMNEPVDHGIWGGLTERERRRHRRQSTRSDSRPS